MHVETTDACDVIELLLRWWFCPIVSETKKKFNFHVSAIKSSIGSSFNEFEIGEH